MSFQNSETFTYTGASQFWAKPVGVGNVYFNVRGGGGGGSAMVGGGGGAYVFTNYIYLQTDICYNVIINVGSGGQPPPIQTGGQSVGGRTDISGNYSNGGTGTTLSSLQSGGGGGMSSVCYMDPISNSNIIEIIAGGGGGGGNNVNANGGIGAAGANGIGGTGSGLGGGQGGNTDGTGNAGLGGANGGVNGYNYVDSSLNNLYTFIGGGGGGGGTFAGGGGGAGYGGGAGGKQGGGGAGGSYASPTARNAFIAGGGGAGGGPGQAGNNGSVQVLWNTQTFTPPQPIVPMYMLNGQHTNKSPYPASLYRPFTSKSLQTTSQTFPNGGVLAYGDIFYIVSGDGSLYAVNSDFTFRWPRPFTAPSGSTFIGTPALNANGTLYIAATTTTLPNYLFAVTDKGSGTNGGGSLKWSYPLNGNSTASPVMDLSGIIYIGTNSGTIYALSDGSVQGLQLWTHNTPDGNAITSTPAFNVSYTQMCYTTYDINLSYVYTLDLTNPYSTPPTQRWVNTNNELAPMNNNMIGTPSIKNNSVYAITYNGNLFGYDMISGTLDISNTFFGNQTSSIAIQSTQPYIHFTTVDSLYSINTFTNTIFDNWNYRYRLFTPGYTLPTSIPTIDAQNNVYFGGSDNYLYSVNALTKSFNWRYPVGGSILGTPIIRENGHIYFGASDGKLYDISLNNNTPPVFTTPTVPMYMLNPQHTGLSPYYGPAATPSLVQSWPVGFTSGNLFVLPSVAIDESGTIYIGSNDRRLYAFQANGTLRWNILLPTGLVPDVRSDSIYTTPLLSPDGTIYIASNDGIFYAINSNGTTKWEFTTDSQIESSLIMDVTTMTIYLAFGRGIIALGDAGYQPYLKWYYPVGVSDDIISSPALGNNNNTLYFASVDGFVYAVDSFTGENKWAAPYDTGKPIYGSPTIDASNNVIIGNGSYMDGSLYYLDGATGLLSNAWATNPFVPPTVPPYHKGPLYNTVAVKDNTIYLSTIVYVYAIDRLTGLVNWTQPFFQTNFYYTSPIVDASGNIYCASINMNTNDGMVHSLKDNGTSVSPNWSYATGAGAKERLGPPVLGSDGTLYLTSTANRIYALK